MKGINKNILYAILGVLVLAIWWKVFKRIDQPASDPETEDTGAYALADRHGLILEREQVAVEQPERDPFYTYVPRRKTAEPEQPSIRQRDAQMQKQRQEAARRRNLPKKEKKWPVVRYHGVLNSREGDYGNYCYVTVDDQLFVKKEGEFIKEGIQLKKIWHDSVRIILLEKDTIIRR